MKKRKSRLSRKSSNINRTLGQEINGTEETVSHESTGIAHSHLRGFLATPSSVRSLSS
jgi:hypothetical protein